MYKKYEKGGRGLLKGKYGTTAERSAHERRKPDTLPLQKTKTVQGECDFKKKGCEAAPNFNQTNKLGNLQQEEEEKLKGKPPAQWTCGKGWDGFNRSTKPQKRGSNKGLG